MSVSTTVIVSSLLPYYKTEGTFNTNTLLCTNAFSVYFHLLFSPNLKKDYKYCIFYIKVNEKLKTLLQILMITFINCQSYDFCNIVESITVNSFLTSLQTHLLKRFEDILKFYSQKSKIDLHTKDCLHFH